jgi:N-acetylmuramoyl-L-alanine amidase
MKVTDTHWLEENASGLPALVRVPSVRSTPLEVDLAGPLGIVWHWTAGPCAGDGFAPALAQSIRTYDKTRDRAASWHVLIAKDGRLFQSVPFNLGSWHVGRPGRIGGRPQKTGDTWDACVGWAGRIFSNINRATVGVELENAGRLERVGDKFCCWPFWMDPDQPSSGPDPHMEIAPERAVQHGAQWFDDFPTAQRDAAFRLLQSLVIRYKWTREVSAYSHCQFDPTRKEDAGPRWLDVLLPSILDQVFGAEAPP